MIRVAIVAESPRLRSELLDVLREAGRFEVVANVPSLCFQSVRISRSSSPRKA